jgi:hypothetical protein
VDARRRGQRRAERVPEQVGAVRRQLWRPKSTVAA